MSKKTFRGWAILTDGFLGASVRPSQDGGRLRIYKTRDRARRSCINSWPDRVVQVEITIKEKGAKRR